MSKRGMISNFMAWRIRRSCEKCYRKFEMKKHPEDDKVPCNGVLGSLFCPSCEHYRRPLKVTLTFTGGK